MRQTGRAFRPPRPDRVCRAPWSCACAACEDPQLVGEGLARRALSVGQEHVQLQSSAVLGAAHQRIAYAALVDEFLAQLRVLSASGLEAGVPPQAEETDTGSEGSDEEYVS